MGRHPFRERNKRFLSALAEGGRGCPLPFIKCEMGTPTPFSGGDNGASPARFWARWGPVSPARAGGVGVQGSLSPLVGQGRGGWRVGLKMEGGFQPAGKRVLEGVGVGRERECAGQMAARAQFGLGSRADPLLDRYLSQDFPARSTTLSPHSHLPFPLSPSQTLLCLLKEMPPTFRDTSAAVW